MTSDVTLGAVARSVSVAIVGAGFGGVATAVRLKQQGQDDIVILERGDRIGGVWRANTYPGIACDVPSHLYSLSFAPNPNWSRRFSPGDEIQAYLTDVAERFDVMPHIRFNSDVERATFDEGSGRWRLEVAGGEPVEAEVLITACGQLTRASIPAVPGLDRFKGPMFHSAHWDRDFDPGGKRVAVIGTGASAIQFVPEIAPAVARLTIFQRSAPWVLGKMDREYPERAKRLHRRVPLIPRLWRRGWWLWFESLVPVFTRPESPVGRLSKAVYTALSQANRFVQLRGDRKLWKATTPDSPVGCKRILITADWFPTLRRDNVELVTGAIREVTEDGVVDPDGRAHPADAIIFGTGFTATEFLAPMEVQGRGGRRLAEDAWVHGAEAYLGIAVPDFPNMFLLYGPNTNHGTGSAVELLEAQSKYVVQAVRLIAEGRAERLEVRRDVHDAFVREMNERLAGSVWVGCSNWYVTAEGRVTNNWPGSQTEYKRRTRTLALADYGATGSGMPPAGTWATGSPAESAAS
jgi:cation diffusion facilitator CzcD-associated flavoprotein CzcO